MSATNYFTRVHGTEGASGGTSAVAPLMASLVALLNQAKQKNKSVSLPESRERSCERYNGWNECHQEHYKGL